MHRIKAVLDTNIIVSGIISPKGSPRKILELAKKEAFKIVNVNSFLRILQKT